MSPEPKVMLSFALFSNLAASLTEDNVPRLRASKMAESNAEAEAQIDIALSLLPAAKPRIMARTSLNCHSDSG